MGAIERGLVAFVGAADVGGALLVISQFTLLEETTLILAS